MQRRLMKVGVAAAVLVIVSLGSYQVAVAGTSPAAVSKSAGLGACATAAGYLRLVDSAAHCASGYTAIKVAQATTSAKDGSITCANGEVSQSRTITTPLGDVVSDSCNSAAQIGDCSVTIDPAGSASVQIGGSVVASYPGDGSVGSAGVTDRHSGVTTTFPNGASVQSASYSSSGATFFADANPAGASLAVHVIVSRPGDSFAVDAALACDSNRGAIELQVTPSS